MLQAAAQAVAAALEEGSEEPIEVAGEDILMTSVNGQMVRISTDDINAKGRGTQGVRVMSFKGADEVSSVSIVEEMDEEETAAGEEGDEGTADAAESPENAADASADDAPDAGDTEGESADAGEAEADEETDS